MSVDTSFKNTDNGIRVGSLVIPVDTGGFFESTCFQVSPLDPTIKNPLIVSCGHSVTGPKKQRFFIVDPDGKQAEAELLGENFPLDRHAYDHKDVALLKIKRAQKSFNLTSLKLAPKNKVFDVGEDVKMYVSPIISNKYKANSQSSGFLRKNNEATFVFESILQATTALVGEGASGSPILNKRKEVIGLFQAFNVRTLKEAFCREQKDGNALAYRRLLKKMRSEGGSKIATHVDAIYDLLEECAVVEGNSAEQGDREI